MNPMIWIAIASTASALAAGGSLWVAAENHWAERVRQSRAEVYARLSPAAPAATKKVHLSVWNEGPGPAYGVTVLVVGGVVNESGFTETVEVDLQHSHQMAPGSSIDALVRFSDNPGRRAMVHLEWRERVVLQGGRLRRLFGRTESTRSGVLRHREIGCETGLRV